MIKHSFRIVRALGLALAAVPFCHADSLVTTALSPDGRNEIRLYDEPFAYEVLRDGEVVAAKAEIGLTVDGAALKLLPPSVSSITRRSSERAPVYKKAMLVLDANEKLVSFGDWALRLTARDDGVAYRFELRRTGEVMVNAERMGLVIPEPDARIWANFTKRPGLEETIPEALDAAGLETSTNRIVYLPLAYAVNGKCVAVTESDLRDYPALYLERPVDTNETETVALAGVFSPRATKAVPCPDWKGVIGRYLGVAETDGNLAATAGTRTFPWRVFILGDRPGDFCAADIVRALATPADPAADYSWVKPGKVAWDWWNDFNNLGWENGCTTEGYEKFIDFAARQGIEYVILDEGWSEQLNIWRFTPKMDVPHIISYAAERGVGIILWLAWAQAYGDEERVAEHFAKMGAKGFKVDFIDRADADVAKFLERFAAACAKHRLLVDYHGIYRPTGLSRLYPNIVNYEGIHGLETAKWFGGGEAAERAALANDVAAFYLRLSAGPVDYTPGAMDNYAPGAGYRPSTVQSQPGALGTRSRQMAMLVLYEAPLQMLCDAPDKYERNVECLNFMAATPVVWADTAGLAGGPETVAAVARLAYDGAWYAAAIATVDGADYELQTDFLGAGEWRAEIFRDAEESVRHGTAYVHEFRTVEAGETLSLKLTPGGGFVIRFSR